MTLLAFGASVRVPLFFLVLGGAAALGLCLAFALALDPRLSDITGAPRAERLRRAVGFAACALFVGGLLWPLWPVRVFGIDFWPVHATGAAALRHVAALAGLGALAFFMSAPGEAPWAPSLRRALAGALVGAGGGLAGYFLNGSLFLCDALMRLGWRNLGGLGLLALPAAFVVTIAVMTALVLVPLGLGPLRRLALGCAAVALWAAAVPAAGEYFRAVWDLGPKSLAAAAGVPIGAEAPRRGILILSDGEGAPSVAYRETALAAAGVDASPGSLRKIRAYLDARGLRTVFLSEALDALRRGWALNWDLDEAYAASMLSRGRAFPPDFKGFLELMTVAPATAENFQRLDEMGRAATRSSFRTVPVAQGIYEGFSTSYARFGDLEMSNAWLERIRGLWPLFEADIHIEPIQEAHDGRISGSVLVGGRPAPDVRIGLFAVPSTMTVIGAYDALTAAARPDEDGRFSFDSLLPGRYYLALQGDPALLGGMLVVRHAPGVLKLEVPQEMEKTLFPIEISRE